MEEKRGTSPWVFIGVGCLLAVFAIVAVVVAIGAWGFSQIRELERTMEDPVARTELAAEYLGTDRVPDGYNAVAAFSIPFLLETVVLTDKAPDDDGRIVGLGERGFIYIKTLVVGDQEQELRDFFEGRIEESELMNQTSIRIDAEELVDRGVIEEASRTLRWASYRGGIGDRSSRELGRGLNTMIMFECPGAERVRMGIWFARIPLPETPVGDADFSGTVADPSGIQEFLSDLDVCAR